MQAEVAEPANREEVAAYLHSRPTVLARGNGRCYGDAALGDHLVSMLSLNRVLHFDGQQGIVQCEAGVLLSDLLTMIVPQGWFFHVTPGVKSITVGGAVASDVHGKNHPKKGCFSNWLISFELLNEHGIILCCSRTENTTLFWQTCGGMGWTGIILSATFQLMPIRSDKIRQTAIRARSLAALLAAFDDHQTVTYAAAWVDGLSKAGRGVLLLAEHEEAPSGGRLRAPNPQPAVNVPFFAPPWLLNPLTMQVHNALVYARARQGLQVVDLDAYFYPLDKIGHWNRLYGRRGLVQYQFCLPEADSEAGLQHILAAVRQSAERPFLSVLKRHGERPPEAVHSFPVKGYSLALDFPRTRTIFDLTRRLDELVEQYNGKIYLTKDACSSPRIAGIDPTAFGSPRFESLLKKRLMAK
jgi:decaprenylphospho-beta-D-ribofuranose 2-oxidase